MTCQTAFNDRVFCVKSVVNRLLIIVICLFISSCVQDSSLHQLGNHSDSVKQDIDSTLSQLESILPDSSSVSVPDVFIGTWDGYLQFVEYDTPNPHHVRVTFKSHDSTMCVLWVTNGCTCLWKLTESYSEAVSKEKSIDNISSITTHWISAKSADSCHCSISQLTNIIVEKYYMHPENELRLQANSSEGSGALVFADLHRVTGK